MKTFIIIFTLGILAVAWAAPTVSKPAEKKYTEEEFQKKLAEEVRAKVDQVKNKSVTELTKELLDKEEVLRLRTLELAKREDQLQVNGTELEKRIKAFEGRQVEILGCVSKNEEDTRNRVSQQVEIVANMQPAKAAQLLSVQEPDIAVQILQMLDSKKASKIFNLMDKEVSARLQKQYLNMKR